jgi:hypothetical protein
LANFPELERLATKINPPVTISKVSAGLLKLSGIEPITIDAHGKKPLAKNKQPDRMKNIRPL